MMMENKLTIYGVLMHYKAKAVSKNKRFWLFIANEQKLGFFQGKDGGYRCYHFGLKEIIDAVHLMFLLEEDLEAIFSGELVIDSEVSPPELDPISFDFFMKLQHPKKLLESSELKTSLEGLFGEVFRSAKHPEYMSIPLYKNKRTTALCLFKDGEFMFDSELAGHNLRSGGGNKVWIGCNPLSILSARPLQEDNVFLVQDNIKEEDIYAIISKALQPMIDTNVVAGSNIKEWILALNVLIRFADFESKKISFSADFTDGIFTISLKWAKSALGRTVIDDWAMGIKSLFREELFGEDFKQNQHYQSYTREVNMLNVKTFKFSKHKQYAMYNVSFVPTVFSCRIMIDAILSLDDLSNSLRFNVINPGHFTEVNYKL